MKRLVLISVLFIAVGAILLELIRNDSGYVLIAVGSTTIEMSFWVGIALLLAAAVVIWIFVFSLARIRGAMRSGLGLAAKRSRRTEARTASGLIHFVESNWRAAKKDLLRAARHAQNPLVHYLAAARCAFELGERDEARKLLHEAEKIAPQNELAVVLSQARMQLLDKRYEQCLATLERARSLAPHHPTVLDLLRQVYWQLRDWPSLEALLPELRKQKLYKEDEQVLLEQNVYMALLSDAGKQGERGASADPHLLANTWHRIPKEIRAQVSVASLYAKLLIAVGEHQEAERFLRSRLKTEWKESFVSLYGLVASPDPRQQLTAAERWLKDHAADPELLLSLGRISLRNQLWGKAREYFERSLEVRACPEAYAELARLLASMGEHERSTELYQQGLLTSTDGLPQLPLPERKPQVAEQQRDGAQALAHSARMQG